LRDAYRRGVRCCGYEELFDAAMARKDADRYRRRGLKRSARAIVELARGAGLERAEVLEIGGGVGGLSLELLRAGAERATVTELSPAWGQEAQVLAAELGLADRITRRVGDVVAAGDEVAAADVVVLERVVCCYPDGEALVGAAAVRARHRLVLSYPRYGLATRLFVRVANLILRLRGNAVRIFAHRPETIRAAAAASGLRPAAPVRGLVWRVAAFERA
jgi:hypothetical protein